MDEISGMLQKIRTLAVQASNGTNTAEDRTALAKEATALVNEMHRISQQTTFAGATVLAGNTKGSIYNTAAGQKGSSGNMTLQVGSNKGDTISFKVSNFTFSKLVSGAKASAGFKSVKGADANAVLFSSATAAQDLIQSMDKLIATVDSQRADLGAIQNHISALKKIESFNSNALLAA